jgi:hypothetical protein
MLSCPLCPLYLPCLLKTRVGNLLGSRDFVSLADEYQSNYDWDDDNNTTQNQAP